MGLEQLLTMQCEATKQRTNCKASIILFYGRAIKKKKMPKNSQ